MQKIWSPWLRLLHWGLALCTIAAFATHEGGGKWHEWLGYISLACAAIRIVLGFTAQGYWRFSQFVRGVAETVRYAKTVLNKTETRYLGHNPLGAWMVLALLANAIACGFTGWLFTTDRFWGMAWLANLHSFLGHAFIPLVALHLAGVLYASWHYKESLIGAMLHGRKKVE